MHKHISNDAKNTSVMPFTIRVATARLEEARRLALCAAVKVVIAMTSGMHQSKVDIDPQSPIQISKRGLRLGTIVRKAASVASAAAKQAYAAASSLDGEMLPLKCCLISISLPWENIVQDLLFKVTA
ncbi:hypothetical protein SASPL_106373 [Salvia splendens]|uniref:Uncharacterized protein n=1 Tax=Salvia splendens TaxID=180675 RepID=A0A8X8YR84_SALSN|nr:hypothetical protein SASPL_106373 [Salvia splendens]